MIDIVFLFEHRLSFSRFAEPGKYDLRDLPQSRSIQIAYWLDAGLTVLCRGVRDGSLTETVDAIMELRPHPGYESITCIVCDYVPPTAQNIFIAGWKSLDPSVHRPILVLGDDSLSFGMHLPSASYVHDQINILNGAWLGDAWRGRPDLGIRVWGHDGEERMPGAGQ